MSVLPSLLFGISASLDALLVGCALGLQKVPLPAKHNLLISAVTLIGTVISISLGNLLLPLIPGEIATRTGSSILILFGLYYAGKQQSMPGEEKICRTSESDSPADAGSGLCPLHE